MGGYQQLVRGEPFRGKFRNSLSRPEPFTPGKAEKIEFWMPDVLHTFRSGHRPGRPISRRRWSACCAEDRTARSCACW
jgi:hypothetical protein